MPERRTLRSRNTLTSHPSPPTPAVATRPRRGASGSSVKVTRDDSNSPDESRKALRLTVKMPSSKLREAMSSSTSSRSPNPGDQLTGAEIISGPRSSRAKKSYVVESESDDDEDDEDEEVEASSDEQVEQEDEEQDEEGEGEEDEEEDPEGEAEEESADEDADADADGDIDMDEDADDGQPLPAPPTILKVNGPTAKTPAKPVAKPTVTVTPAQDAHVKSVEAKEMEMEDDDEELSELSENDDEDDAEGDDDVDMEQDDEGRSDAGSRGSTPDVSKMTKRQQGRLNQVVGSDFLQLPMGMYHSLTFPLSMHRMETTWKLTIIYAEPQTKKHLTAEEHAMRRAEMARRRKNLSEKRNEEEKVRLVSSPSRM